MSNNKKHILRNILLIILAVLIIAVGVIAYLYRDVLAQIPSLYKSMMYSNDEISSMQAENDKKQNEILNELVEGTMRDLTDEERALLASGELSKEEALALIQGLLPSLDITVEVTETSVPETTEEITEVTTEVTTVADTSAPVVTTAATTAPKDEPAAADDKAAKENRISEIIAEIYLLRATYINKIDELLVATKEEFYKLPKEQRNTKGKLMTIDRYLRPKGNELEAECDAKMNELLTEMKALLLELNMSTDIIGEIEAAYKEQKQLKTAELYGLYSPKLK